MAEIDANYYHMMKRRDSINRGDSLIRGSLKRLPHWKCHVAFSLTEVSLALALVGFAFVSLMALIPPGMNSFRVAMDTQTATEIYQRVAADLQEADFDSLLNEDGTTVPRRRMGTNNQYYEFAWRYFDTQGRELRVANPETPTTDDWKKINYAVRVRGSLPGVANPANHTSAHFTSLPDINGRRFNPRDVTFLTIQVVGLKTQRNLRSMIDPATALLTNELATKGGVSLRTYTVAVARNGYIQ